MSDADALLPVLADTASDRLAALGREMRAERARVGLGELVTAHRALAAVDCSSREDARIALRAVMCSRREDLERFDRAFLTVFGGDYDLARAHHVGALGEIEKPVPPRVGIPTDTAPPTVDEDSHPVPAAWSEIELLHEKDFAKYSDAEMALARELIARLARRTPMRLSRRTRPTRVRGHQPDLRRVLRASMRTGGEPVERYWRGPSLRPRPVVLVCDVSGSMEPYARMLMQYLHACVAARRRVEAFAFGTRLARLTSDLAIRDPEVALARVTSRVVDWGSGTRIGASLAQFNDEYGRRALSRGAVVVIASDGWERDDPISVGREMARLSRSAYAVVWVNPLKGTPEYEPLAQGMRAALPYVDRFLPGHNLESLEGLGGILAGIERRHAA